MLFSRFVLMALFVAALLVTGPLLYHYMDGNLTMRPPPVRQKMDAVMVFSGSSNRLVEGYDYFLKGRTNKLMITGNDYPRIAGDHAVKRLLRKVKARKDQIYIDLKARNTIENAQNGASWALQNRVKNILLITTSAVFAYDMPWDKLDVTTWSWQKVLGGEGAHGMLVLSPRAVERLETYKPPRPLPKIFRMTKGGKFSEGIFKGETINTPSMMAVEDCLDALRWVESIGGLPATIKRAEANFAAAARWVEKSPVWAFLCEDDSVRSRTSITLKIKDAWFNALGDEERQAFIKTMVKPLDKENVAYDIASYRDAPAGLRIWGGATVEAADIEALMPWLDWAYESAKGEAREQAA